MTPDQKPMSLAPLMSEAASITGDADLGRLLRTLVKEAKTATGAKYAALGVLGEHGSLVEFIYEGVSVEEASEIGHPPTGKGVLGTVITANDVILLDSISSHPDSAGFPPHHPPMSRFLGVPVVAGEERFGNLYLTDKDESFDETDVETVQALSRIAGIAIQTARLQRRLRQVAVIEDRQRIARDLHDSVIQDLFAIGLGLQGMQRLLGEDDDEFEQGLSSAIDGLDSSVNALRGYVLELKETSARPTGLDERIQALVARMGSVYPAEVELSISPIRDVDWGDEAVLLLTEALSNALRHSRSQSVAVEVDEVDDELVMKVIDRGVGFSMSEDPQGMGLANMRARVLSLAGDLDIHSSADDGTTVTMTLPLGF